MLQGGQQDRLFCLFFFCIPSAYYSFNQIIFIADSIYRGLGVLNRTSLALCELPLHKKGEFICFLPTHTCPPTWSPGRTGELASGRPLRLRPQSCTASAVTHTQHAMPSDVGGRKAAGRYGELLSTLGHAASLSYSNRIFRPENTPLVHTRSGSFCSRTSTEAPGSPSFICHGPHSSSSPAPS